MNEPSHNDVAMKTPVSG